MVGFLKWCGRRLAGAVNGLVQLVLALVVVVLAVAAYGLVKGDGMPENMVLTLDLRSGVVDSAPADYSFGEKTPTVMDVVLGLDAAARDARVAGAYVRLGEAPLSVAQAEELGDAFRRFRRSGKFLIAYAQNFSGSLGAYLTAASAEQIWMQPSGTFAPSGLGGSKLYLRGLLDKIGVTPEISKRADYKSAAEMYMDKAMSPADREQTMALLNSVYGTAVSEAAAARKLAPAKVTAALNASPLFPAEAQKAGLIDRLGFDDDAEAAAKARAGAGAKLVSLARYAAPLRAGNPFPGKARIAVICASGEIVDGTSDTSPFGGDAKIGGDDTAAAIRAATKDDSVRAIILRVDSPGGSVTASDQILDAVQKAKKVKPVVVSMASYAASGGYYISLAASRIVAEPATITGSIGVFGGKMSGAGTLGKLGIGTATVSVGGPNAQMYSPFAPFTAGQRAALDRQLDGVYADFTAKVAAGRKLPIAKVREIAKGRVWSGRDARGNGLVDETGGFWAAVDSARKLAKIAPGAKVAFEQYPRPLGLVATLRKIVEGGSAMVRSSAAVSALLDSALGRRISAVFADSPRTGVEVKTPEVADTW